MPNNPDRKLRTRQGLPESVNEAARLFLSIKESKQILAQLQQSCIPNKQVLWSGMTKEVAQGWADKHHLQTLTTAMGPLMDTHDPRCPRRHKSHDAWATYVHGASVLFSWYIAGGDNVTVLSQPPPQRFNPTGEAYYQTVEEPIITGKLCDRHVSQISAVHPCVKEATDFEYELWPEDHVSSWNEMFGKIARRHCWRPTKLTPEVRNLKAKILSEDVVKQLTGPLSSGSATSHVNRKTTRKKKSARLGEKQNFGQERQMPRTRPVKTVKKKVRTSQNKGKEEKQKAQDEPNGGLKPERRMATVKEQLIAAK